MNRLLLKIFLVFVGGSLLPAAKPVEPMPVLTIARTYDKNEIHYFINTTSNGQLTKEPISLKWANFEEKNGAYEEMNYIKKQFGYRPIYTRTETNRAEFHFVSFDKKTFKIKKTQNGQFAIFTTFNNQEIAVKRIFIHMEGGTFWAPNILYAEVYGVDLITKKDIVEKIKP